MKILCLHGRGSNNEIFQTQTAFLRSNLDDFTFDFVQGTEPHTEGNWSIYTSQFSKLPQYTYYNLLIPSSIRDAELRLLDLIKEEGGYDGVMGYSGGAAFAAQAMIRHSKSDAGGSEPLFRFAVFINGGTPLKTFPLDEEQIVPGAGASAELERELQATFLRPSNLRARKGDNREEAEAAIAARKKEIDKASTGRLADGRSFLTDGEFGVTRYEGGLDGALIDVPTLHVRCPNEENADFGLNLMRLCEPGLAREHYHPFGHDFPRGQEEMRRIARAIAELAESA
ncbi:serine hydrolase FSH [Coniochaeta sp. 2T2.1]|nr:serine hydrolase FSH [Coniochaeta sp. 2T2.1]